MLCGLLSSPFATEPQTKEAEAFFAALKEVEIGVSSNEVARLLGPPDFSWENFHPQVSHAYRWHYCLVPYGHEPVEGAHPHITVGFDKHDRVEHKPWPTRDRPLIVTGQAMLSNVKHRPPKEFVVDAVGKLGAYDGIELNEQATRRTLSRLLRTPLAQRTSSEQLEIVDTVYKDQLKPELLSQLKLLNDGARKKHTHPNNAINMGLVNMSGPFAELAITNVTYGIHVFNWYSYFRCQTFDEGTWSRPEKDAVGIFGTTGISNKAQWGFKSIDLDLSAYGLERPVKYEAECIIVIKLRAEFGAKAIGFAQPASGSESHQQIQPFVKVTVERIVNIGDEFSYRIRPPNIVEETWAPEALRARAPIEVFPWKRRSKEQ